ncbi:hypothetical protein ACRAWD_02180 [Caulobacter segnis]
MLESEARIGRGVSSRNSEGDPRRALLSDRLSEGPGCCVQGRRALYAFLDLHGVAHQRAAELVVATSEGTRSAPRRHLGPLSPGQRCRGHGAA